MCFKVLFTELRTMNSKPSLPISQCKDRHSYQDDDKNSDLSEQYVPVGCIQIIHLHAAILL